MLPENCFVLTKSAAKALTKSRLYGYGITDKAVILGSEGLEDYFASGETEIPVEGRFCGIFVDENYISIRTDATGQDMIFLFRDGDDWIVSNSFVLLAQQAALRHKLSFYAPAALGFHLKNGAHIGEQLVSHRTMVNEITIVPLTSYLRVDRRTGAIEEVRGNYKNLFSMEKRERYKDVFIDVAERISGVLAAFVNAGMPINLSLSGGYDSRLVLCLLMAAKSDFSAVRVTSNVNKEKDFRVATALADRLSLPLNKPRQQKIAKRNAISLSSVDSIRMYLLSCAGTYLPFYPVRAMNIAEEAEILLTGDHPIGVSFFSGKARFNGSAEKIAYDILQELTERGQEDAVLVQRDFLSTFDAIGVDPADPAAMMAFYSSIRARHHGGRNWYKSQGSTFLVSPLMQGGLISLGLHNQQVTPDGEIAGVQAKKKFYADAFSIFGSWALDEPFETPDRAFSQELLDASPFRGGVSLSPRPFKLFGRIGGNAAFDKPDIHSIPVSVNSTTEEIKRHLHTMFNRADKSRASNVFTAADLVAANEEMNQSGSLSHGYRKVSHVVATDTILDIVDTSSR